MWPFATTNKAYAVDETSITLLPEVNLNGATYQDGYGIFSQAGTEKFWLSGLDDMTTIDALDFSSADVFADELKGCVSDHRELWLFGKTSTEVWVNTGDASFPFARAGGGFMERGCAASGSISKADNAVYWLGDDLRVYRAEGYQPQPISTPAIEILIEGTEAQEGAWSFVYDQAGHKFYVLGFNNLTIVFDVTTGLWHERKSQGLDRWRVRFHAEFDEKQLVGDAINNQIYDLSLTTYTDDGDEIRREIVTPPLHAQTSRAFMSELRLDVEPGVGLTSGQGSDPQWFLDWSDDGGHSWSNELWRSPGGIGEYATQVRWHGLGAFRSRTLRFAISDPVKAVVLGAYARIEQGAG